MSGPPIVLWLEAHGIGPSEFRASLAASFLALNLIGWVMLIASEGSPSVDAGVVVPLLGVVVVGYALGTLAFRRLGSERFFAIALALVLCSGVASLVAGLAASVRGRGASGARPDFSTTVAGKVRTVERTGGLVGRRGPTGS